jgi:hypothetical protein
MVEPERVVMFRVPRVDDSVSWSLRMNRGSRAQLNSDRSVQGRPSVPVECEHLGAEVPRLRAGVEELADDAPDRRI